MAFGIACLPPPVWHQKNNFAFATYRFLGQWRTGFHSGREDGGGMCGLCSLWRTWLAWREAPWRTEMISVSMMTMMGANVLVKLSKVPQGSQWIPPLHPLIEHAMPLETRNSFPLCLQWANTKRLDRTQTSLSPWPWGLLLWDECGFLSIFLFALLLFLFLPPSPFSPDFSTVLHSYWVGTLS